MDNVTKPVIKAFNVTSYVLHWMQSVKPTTTHLASTWIGTFLHNNWHALHLLRILIWWNALNQINSFHLVIATHKVIQEFHHLDRKQCWYVINQALLPSQEISRTLCSPKPLHRPGGSGWATWTGMPGLTRPTWLRAVLPKLGTLSRQDRHGCPATL